jgi:hypothetical protein
MRRWAATLTCVAVLSAAAGCSGTRRGIDGDLTDGWRPMPAATQFRPAAGVCHDELARSGALEDYAPVPCTQTHVAARTAGGATPGGCGATWLRSRRSTPM